jgi:hypothetical protein
VILYLVVWVCKRELDHSFAWIYCRGGLVDLHRWRSGLGWAAKSKVVGVKVTYGLSPSEDVWISIH